MPVPPAAVGLRIGGVVVAEVARQHAPGFRDMAQHGIELRLEALAVPVAPARAQARLLAQEAPLPVGKEAARDDRGVVRPVLEQQAVALVQRSEEHTSELQSLMRISYAVFCLKKKNKQNDK